MEQPQIQFARTSDGVSIAYQTMGEGPPVLYCASIPSVSMQSRLSDPSSPAPQLATSTRLTDFDHAGIGASQRDVGDFSLDAQVRAIEAVTTRFSDDPLTIVGNTSGSASGALYAIRHPDRVRALACINPGFVPMEHMVTEIRENWSFARRRAAGFTFPDGPVATQRWYGTALRESMEAEVAAAYVEENARSDLREIFRAIPVPTLLCVPKAGPGSEASLALASLVPDCRVVVESAGTDRSAAATAAKAAILEFMGIAAAPGSQRATATADVSGAAVILFTDIVSSTELTERMGDSRFRDASRALDAGLRAAIRESGGVTVEAKTLGDGVLATFGSAAQAIEGARRCLALSAASELGLHIGVHAGDVIREEGNVFGGAVNIAARICGLSAAGEILVSDVVRGMARSSAGVVFEDRGEQEMKGVGEPVRVYAVVSSS